MTSHKATSLLRKGLPLMVTLSQSGPVYTIDGLGAVPTKWARLLTADREIPTGDLLMVPNEDGLFPGFSQTWRTE
jgi:hypothetical protein